MPERTTTLTDLLDAERYGFNATALFLVFVAKLASAVFSLAALVALFGPPDISSVFLSFGTSCLHAAVFAVALVGLAHAVRNDLFFPIAFAGAMTVWRMAYHFLWGAIHDGPVGTLWESASFHLGASLVLAYALVLSIRRLGARLESFVISFVATALLEIAAYAVRLGALELLSSSAPYLLTELVVAVLLHFGISSHLRRRRAAAAVLLDHTPQAVGAAPGRGGCLTAFLWLAVGANALSAVLYLFVLDLPDTGPLLGTQLGLFSIANAIFAGGALNWKKWGVYGFCVTGLAAFLMNAVELSVAHAIPGLVGLGLLIGLVWPVWEHFQPRIVTSSEAEVF